MPTETEPLLPRYEDDTARQRQLHQKLHTYQMLRALSQGYLPSTEQAIANLRTLLASDVLNLRKQDIGTTGRQLVRDARLWLTTFIEFLHEKNNTDHLQQFLWRLSRARVSVDQGRALQQAAHVKARADAKAAYDSFRTVGSLLLTNADFRLFVDDVATVGRQIFADTAESLAEASKRVADEVQPSEEEQRALEGAGADEGRELSSEEVKGELEHIADVAGKGVARTGEEAAQSAKEHLSGRERETLLYRLKKAVQRLRERSDYTDSVSTITQLIQRYAALYANAAEDTADAAQEDVEVNEDLKKAVDEFWVLLRSFGSAEEWDKLQEQFHALLQHANKDPEFEQLMGEAGTSLRDMLTDPDFFDHAPEKLDELQQKSSGVTETNLRNDLDKFLLQTKRTLRTIPDDPGISKLIAATKRLYQHTSTAYTTHKSDLPADMINIILPVLIRTIQYIPIPRLEVYAPELSLLLENLILEPGHSVNFTSFLPYRMHVTTRNDIDIQKKHAKQTTTTTTTAFTLTINGLNISASEFGYILKPHLFPNDSGIASFALDRRGVDITLDINVGKNLSSIFTLRGVRVRIHKLDYKIHQSRWKWLLWLAKPFLKHLLRRILEKKIAEEIVLVAKTVNRELVFARERLRATRVANPGDLVTFVRAVLARLKPGPSDVEARLAFSPAKEGVFKDTYAPGSIVKVWREEALNAGEVVEDADGSGSAGLEPGWRNGIFDVVGR
ncbi:hypothetical protein N7532_003511 [Penicillium argentinense]|uniref:HAM1-like N-terminal domain-containing protein n=1 Tax=Penicillium argentinense TaxID=1131581 RepID=A0A9W9FN14_9EURO|nr:uncharacterized protein N7532_003511 [Penicillium argentinense]KAJ5102982.1 hypothetical protein N7532_003511 [Penicillium argentinense]